MPKAVLLAKRRNETRSVYGDFFWFARLYFTEGEKITLLLEEGKKFRETSFSIGGGSRGFPRGLLLQNRRRGHQRVEVKRKFKD
jgi:hypothetical protein